ncbi:MAG: hypothetical protein JWN86_3101 [Planctomycetota bacterium]|nr:hypothetical protein [Planctomycetota bacterium]
MPLIYIECPKCAWEGKIDETLVGSRLKCGKCGTSFVAESGDAYDLVPPTRPPEPEAPLPPTGPVRTSKSKPGTEPKTPDPRLEKLMDQWAEE